MLTNEQITKVKGLGCLRDKTTEDCFNVRTLTVNGKLKAEQLNVIIDAAKKFGNGEIAFTTRLTVEIQKVPYDNIEPLRAYLNEFGIETGGTGPKVRPVVSCKGTTCVFGLIDTFKLSEQIHYQFYKWYHDIKLPHKFKIAVGGCPNNCVKPDLNDVGVIGQKVPKIDLEKCKGCKVCVVEKACPMKAISVIDNKVSLNTDICNNCGRCITKCPFKAFEQFTTGYRVFVGGRWGKKYNRGIPLTKIFNNEQEVLNIIEKIILVYKDLGIQGERLSETIERIGFNKVESILYSNELIERKDEILKK